MSKGRIVVTEHRNDGIRVDVELPWDFLNEVENITIKPIAGSVLSGLWGTPTTHGTSYVRKTFKTRTQADAFVAEVQADLADVVMKTSKPVTRIIDLDL